MNTMFNRDSSHPLHPKVIYLSDFIAYEEMIAELKFSATVLYYARRTGEFPKQFNIGRRAFFLRCDYNKYSDLRQLRIDKLARDKTDN